jgi:serine/threonine-protein kinase
MPTSQPDRHGDNGQPNPSPSAKSAADRAGAETMPPAPAPPGEEASEPPTMPPRPATSERRTEGETMPPRSVPVEMAGTEGSTPQVSIPGYDILGELGRGGMGVVYRARQTKLNRLVALKMVLAGGHAGEADLARFVTEAEAIARLQHPNIVQIYEVGEFGGLPFFSLEFCHGGSLDKKLAGTPMSPREAAALVETLARAMHAAHEKGVIHRDLKPANVLLAAGDTPKVTDFGLAKKLDEAGQTASGAIMGTPSYMAPEQAGGKSKEIGPATDVYALGAILYELLTGRPPFKAAMSLDTILQVVSDEPVPPRRLQSRTPKDLDAICLKCLEKDPHKRYPSAAALAEDLARFRCGEPVTAQQSGLIGQLAEPLDRVQLQAQFGSYSSLLLWLAPVMFLPELWITTVVMHNWHAELLAVAQFGRATGVILLVGYYRGWSWTPRGADERQLWAVWIGYLLACFVLGLSGRIALGFLDPALELKFYQGLAALTAVAFFALAGKFWGYCAVLGLAFLGLAFVMAADLRWAPVEFGAAWAAVLILLGLRLRRLAQQVNQ